MEISKTDQLKQKLKDDPMLLKYVKGLKAKFDKDLKTAEDRSTTLEKAIGPLCELISEQKDEAKRYKRKIHEMEQALKPLANLMMAQNQKFSDDHEIYCIAPGRGDPRPIIMGHIRMARRLLKMPLSIPMVSHKTITLEDKPPKKPAKSTKKTTKAKPSKKIPKAKKDVQNTKRVELDQISKTEKSEEKDSSTS